MYTIRFCAVFLASIFASAPLETFAQESSGMDLAAKASKNVRNIDTLELAAILEERPDTVLIDVRTPSEINLLGGTIDAPRNVNIPRGWLEYRVADEIADKNWPIVVYCGINQRSPLAADTLMKMGYTNVYNYSDGFFAWRDTEFPVDIPDRAPQSMLYDYPREIVPGVWSAIGDTAPPTYENSGHNNNLSFIVTDEGVVVINAGDNYLLAQSLHDEIKKITDQPVKYVVLENGQGHAMLGSSYWKQQDVPIIAHRDTAREIEENGYEILDLMKIRSRDKASRTELVEPDETFDDQKIIEMGGTSIELLYLGPAHGPGDVVVWLPQRRLVISGDMAFHERLLPVFETTNTAAWIETWDKFATLGAEIVIPGHGGPTNMSEVTKYTRDYLVYMRSRIRELIDAGGELMDAYDVDQSAYAHLDTFRELAKRNADAIFREMEFD